jgi:hypothetical protein
MSRSVECYKYCELRTKKYIVVVAYLKILSWHVPRGTKKSLKLPSQNECRTRDLPNTKQDFQPRDSDVRWEDLEQAA